MNYNFQAAVGEQYDSDNNLTPPFYILGLSLQVGDGHGGTSEPTDSSGVSPNPFPTLDDMIQDDPQGFVESIMDFVKSKLPANSLSGPVVLNQAVVNRDIDLLAA